MSEKFVCPCCGEKSTSEEINAYKEQERVYKEFEEIHADDLVKINKKRDILFYGSVILVLSSFVTMFYEKLPIIFGFNPLYLLMIIFFGGFIGVLTNGFWYDISKRKRLFKNFKASRKNGTPKGTIYSA